ncbi:hypothetical protein V1477_019064 [Vespula maculifrons]|uniref:Uncharacterized protein n=1 Tax=Vespula maculifrons TaxID=7453 RepID=A0ABD2AU06_VESMC
MGKNRATKSLDRIAATSCEEILMRITRSRVPNSDRRPVTSYLLYVPIGCTEICARDYHTDCITTLLLAK